MRLGIHKLVMMSAVLLLCAGYAPAATQKAASKPVKHGHHKSKAKRKASWKKKGQQGISSDRAMEIQQALIRENYLSGEPTGTWDARTQAALGKYQGDNGWQTKVVPDSRALIKLGLGPNYSAELINGPAKTAPTAAANSSTVSRGINDTASKQ